MDAEIAVSNPTPDTEIALFNFSYTHIGCNAGPMRWSHDQANDLRTISCPCGLAITFPQHEAATKAIAYASTDLQAHELLAGSFTSSQARTVRIIGTRAA